MWKVLCFFLLVADSSVLGQLCGNKTEYKCQCKQVTDETSHLPLSIADCSGLNLDTFPYEVEDDINYLLLSVNNIEALDPKQQKLVSKDLQSLILSHNKIRRIDDEFFLNVDNLRELDLSHNYISSLDDGDIFQNLNKLVKLDLSFNGIKTLPNGFFDDLVNIRHLDLSYNSLGEFLSSSKDMLTTTLSINTKLTHLGLNGLNISNLHSSYFDDYTSLKYLSLANNAFEFIPTVPYSLEHLDLSGNKFAYISARYLNYHSLKVLNLNRMATLTDIHHYAFYNLVALEKLSITDCPNLKEFSELAFDVASKNTNLHPKYLYLARNGLRRLNESYRYFFKNMELVDLSHNPWKCDCDILWLTDFEHILYNPREIRCGTPDEISHRSVLDLIEKDLPDCYPAIYGKKSHRILIVILASSMIALIGLIFYLMRYPSSWLGIVVGPNSPYNLAPTIPTTSDQR